MAWHGRQGSEMDSEQVAKELFGMGCFGRNPEEDNFTKVIFASVIVTG